MVYTGISISFVGEHYPIIGNLGVHYRLLDMPTSVSHSAIENPARVEREQIRYELAHLTQQIHNLQISENDRLARELKAIELNIQETERHMNMVCLKSFLHNILTVKLIC